jgi:hypothetical protein
LTLPFLLWELSVAEQRYRAVLEVGAVRPSGRVRILRALIRIRFVKVAEYQARGVVHFHAIIRLDAPGEDYQAPPPASPSRRYATPSA